MSALTGTLVGRRFRLVAAIFYMLAGGFYVGAPPRTTASFFDASWPSIAWGVLMVAGGIVTITGLRTRIIQVEQYGMLMILVATAMLALTRTAVMLDPPPVFTRGGGVFVLWAQVAFAAARYSELSADIRAARAARKIAGE